jgi:hypothetical protein
MHLYFIRTESNKKYFNRPLFFNFTSFKFPNLTESHMKTLNSMSNTARIAASVAALVAASVPMLAQAESATVSAATGALTTNARLDFRITVPKVLFLRVGTGGLYGAAASTTVDLIDFTVPAANLGDASVIAGTGGDLGAGAVTALLRSNAGNVTLTANTLGALSNGAAGDTIPWTQIAVASANLAAPAFANTLPHSVALPATGATANFAPAAVAKVTNVGSQWTYTYLNAATVPAGTYGGVNTNNGRVTYTASVL